MNFVQTFIRSSDTNLKCYFFIIANANAEIEKEIMNILKKNLFLFFHFSPGGFKL